MILECDPKGLLTSTAVKALLRIVTQPEISFGEISADASHMVEFGTRDAVLVFDRLIARHIGKVDGGVPQTAFEEAFRLSSEAVARFAGEGLSLALQQTYLHSYHDEMQRRLTAAYGKLGGK